MSVYEIIINTKNKCYQCKFLKLDEDGWTGYCECKNNRVKNRYRHVTDKACSFKSRQKEGE